MKRARIFILVLAASLSALADDLPLKDGSILRNVSIISAEPTRMLIVHDEGGAYVPYSILATNALSSARRGEIELMIKAHVKRAARLEEARAIKEAEERSMRRGGFVLFEGCWMRPSDIELISQTRRTAVLEREKLRLDIAKKKAEIDAQNARARQLLNGGRGGGAVFINSGYGARRYGGPYNWGCYPAIPLNPCR